VSATDEFVPIADADELWDGEMEAYDVDGEEVLLVKLDGRFHAYDGVCPHQSVALVEGELDDGVLTCRAHEWQFDAATGAGINPSNAALRRHEVRVTEDGKVAVRLCSRSPAAARQ
jgi:Ferredoxin subunits of nitrite reductase and ring-hydroxylating dioxygenases